MQEFELKAFLPYRFSVIANAISRRFAERYSARFGISVAEWRVLAHLQQEAEISIRELQPRIDMDKAKATRAAQRLADLGLVRRSENSEDRRLVSLALTPDGERVAAEIIAIAIEFQETLLEGLGSAERDALEHVFQHLHERLDALASEPDGDESAS